MIQSKLYCNAEYSNHTKAENAPDSMVKFAEEQMVPGSQAVNYFQVSAHGNNYYLSIVLIVNIGYTVGILLLDKDKRVFTSYTLLIPKQDLSVV